MKKTSPDISTAVGPLQVALQHGVSGAGYIQRVGVGVQEIDVPELHAARFQQAQHLQPVQRGAFERIDRTGHRLGEELEIRRAGGE